jgi:predicted XRE-type DNA-binding protein
MNDELKELRDIKKLLILLLEANDVDQGEIAGALGVTQSAVSHLLNPKEKKDAKKGSKEEQEPK